ncbi:MAG: hypothetical protein QOJ52_3051 [Acidimicrobiaceae bacterium]|jgi:hypothetical protein|nr:hypothetical protein [Acidimicrobiaceae bacterium]MDQ1421089.1 hypothetical protein [Acidimicrobiaceae bacterium]
MILAVGLAGTLGLSLLAAPVASAKGGGGGTPPAALQADWPAAVPLPAGVVQGTNGAAPSETVALLVNTSYQEVVRSVTALYVSHGFSQLPDGTLVFSTSAYRVTVGGAARDHSPTQTNVTVWLQTL